MNDRELYEAGWSLREIEKKTGTPHSTIRGRLAREGVERRPPGGDNNKRTDHQAFRTTAFLYERLGLSSAEIAERLGIHPTSVIYRLKQHGTSMRPRGESMKIRNARKKTGLTRVK